MEQHANRMTQLAGARLSPCRIGMIAGWGRYPILVARALKRQGYQIHCLGVLGEADPALAEICDDFRWNGVARFGTAIRYFRQAGVSEATMLGKVHKTVLFQPWRWGRILPDLRTIRMFLPHFLTRNKDCRDDSLVGTFLVAFAAEGIHFRPPTDYVPELLLGEGTLTDRAPSTWQQKDIRFGWKMAREMGRLDIGQSVAVKNQAVLAVEAIEGTDQCIRRAGRLCPSGGFTVVKVAKPQQDMRFDVPTIGLGTLQSMIDSRAKVLAVEAHRTIVVDHDEMIEFANRNKLVIVSMEDPHGQQSDRPQTSAA